jgi:hypothetical protein
MPKTRRVVKKASARQMKTRRLFVLKKGLLTKHGYHADLAEPARHEALQRALGEFTPLSLYRKLIAVYVLNKNRDKKRAQIFRSDANWVKTTPDYINRKKI